MRGVHNLLPEYEGGQENKETHVSNYRTSRFELLSAQLGRIGIVTIARFYILGFIVTSWGGSIFPVAEYIKECLENLSH